VSPEQVAVGTRLLVVLEAADVVGVAMVVVLDEMELVALVVALNEVALLELVAFV
jgi:hypothetical protein